MDYALDWPPPPLVPHWLFENPWPLCILLLTFAVALALIGWKRMQRRPMIFGAIAAAMAGLVVLVATLVETDREQMARGTRELVRAAVVPVDLDAFRQRLSPEVRFFERDRDQIVSLLERSAGRWRVRQAYITRLDTHQDDPTHGQTYLSVITPLETNFGGGSAQTRWILSWAKESDGVWRITRIKWLTFNDREAREGDLP